MAITLRMVEFLISSEYISPAGTKGLTVVIKACAMALKKHPKVNSQWKEEATIINHHVNVGVAVAVEDFK